MANFGQQKDLSNINFHTKVKLLNEFLTNIFMNFVSNKLMTADDTDPLWVTEKNKKLLKDKRKLNKQYVKNGKMKGDYEKV